MRPSNTKRSTTFGAVLGAITATAVLLRAPTLVPEIGLTSVAERSPASLVIPTEAPRLLFITFDGVRTDEFFDCMLIGNLEKSNCSFPKLWAEVRAKRFEVTPMVVGNSRALSLPGYQSIYSGKNQDKTCRTNTDCDQVPDRTWLENIRYARGLLPHEVAVIASWDKMPLAVEKNPGSIYVNAGVVDMMDPTRENETVPELKLPSAWQSEKGYLPEWENARADRFTFTYAQWYLTHLKPQVLVASFLDSDELGHLDRYSAYQKKLRTYDGYIQNFIADLKYIGALDNTIIFITTDHGRGSGYFGYAFKGHGPDMFLENSYFTWAAISVPEYLRPRLAQIQKAHGRRAYSQLDIRPMIEELMIPLPKTTRRPSPK